MNEAIKIGIELVSDRITPTEEQTIKHMDELKPAINNLLHQFLPDDITLKEVDIIAMVINEIIWKPKDFLNSVSNQKCKGE